MKRPLGLAKTKKASKRDHVDEPERKRARTEKDEEAPDGDVAGADVTQEDWEDLKELFARAKATFDDDVISALPLLRGVLHECDRISRNCSDASSLISTAEGTSLDDPKASLDSSTSFYALYGDALLHLGLVIGGDPHLAAEGEPDSPLTYFEAALNTITDGYKRHPNSRPDWELQYAWARVLIMLADIEASSVNEGEVDHAHKDFPESSSRNIDGQPYRLLSEAKEHFESALAQFPKDCPREDAFTQDDNQSLLSKPMTISSICYTIAISLFDVAELLAPEGRQYWTGWALTILSQGKSRLSSDDSVIAYGLSKGLGRLLLSSIPDKLGEDFEENPDIIQHPEIENARATLKEAVASFDNARSVVSAMSAKERLKIDDEDLRNLLCEALLYLANLTEDAKERGALFSRVEEEGMNLSDEDSEDGDEDVD